MSEAAKDRSARTAARLALAAVALAALAGPLLAADPAAEAAGQETSLLSGSVWNAIWAAAVFLGLLAVLGRLVWRPVVKVLQEREQKVADTIARTEQSRQEAVELLGQYKRQLDQAQADAKGVVERARQQADQAATEILDQARTEAEKAREQAVEQIRASKDEAVAALFEEAADLAAKAAGQILQREISADDNRQLIEQALREAKPQPWRGP